MGIHKPACITAYDVTGECNFTPIGETMPYNDSKRVERDIVACGINILGSDMLVVAIASFTPLEGQQARAIFR